MKKVVTMVTTKRDKFHKPTEWEQIKWEHSEYCQKHSPNYQKKAEKAVNKANKKEHRGYTKSIKKRR